MPKISRNAPCPCGSGLKHKMCCLAKIEQEEARRALRDKAAQVAMDWLLEHYPEEVKDAIAVGFCQGFSEAQLNELGELPEDLQSMFQINLFEWLITEGAMADGETERFIDRVLGDGGPLLEVTQREYLELMADQPMGLYEAVEAKPNEGLWLRDTLDAQSEKIWVRDRAASRSLRPGDVLGARIIQTDPKVLSGCLYPFPQPQYIRIRRAILDGSKDTGGRVDPAWISEVIIKEWLWSLIGGPPQMVDFAGQSLTPTTVHFRLKDSKRFERAIEGQPDVVGDAKKGWSRLEGDRSLYGIRRTKKDRVELFALSRERAEAGETWLAEIAGDAIEKTVSEVHDVTRVWKDRFKNQEARDTKKKSEILDGLSKEDKSAFFEQLYHKIYARWADEPVPALGDKTPREAARTEEGGREVAELLRTYEAGEERKAEMEDRAPVCFDFLWDQVGLRREDFAR